MALSKVDVANMLTGATPVANGGTALTSGFLNGIGGAQQFRLNTTFTGDADPISSNVEAADTDTQGVIGSAMTVSSGIFTFPSTGIWLIEFTAQFHFNGNSRTNQLVIHTTVNNSSYSPAGKNNAGIAQSQSSHTYNTGSTNFIFDVTNVTTHKVKFSSTVNDDSASTAGETDANRTFFTFIRLGDT